MMEESMNIEINEEVAEGIYSNFAIIAHSSSEFVMDFIRILPGTDKATVKSRVICSAEQAKRLLLSLQENIRGYEATYGDIKIHSNIEQQIPISPLGEA